MDNTAENKETRKTQRSLNIKHVRQEVLFVTMWNNLSVKKKL